MSIESHVLEFISKHPTASKVGLSTTAFLSAMEVSIAFAGGPDVSPVPTKPAPIVAPKPNFPRPTFVPSPIEIKRAEVAPIRTPEATVTRTDTVTRTPEATATQTATSTRTPDVNPTLQALQIEVAKSKTKIADITSTAEAATKTAEAHLTRVARISEFTPTPFNRDQATREVIDWTRFGLGAALGIAGAVLEGVVLGLGRGIVYVGSGIWRWGINNIGPIFGVIGAGIGLAVVGLVIHRAGRGISRAWNWTRARPNWVGRTANWIHTHIIT